MEISYKQDKELRNAEVIKEQIVMLNYHKPYGGEIESKEPVVFTAYRTKEGRILVVKDDPFSGKELFCDYLKTDQELKTFFDHIEIEEYILDNATFGTHYGYGENPKDEYEKVIFSVFEKIDNMKVEIIFSDGMWFTTMENEEIVGDIAECSRDAYIEAFKEKLLEWTKLLGTSAYKQET